MTWFANRTAIDPGGARFRAGSRTLSIPAALGLIPLIACVLLPAFARAADDLPEEYRLAVGFYNKEQWKPAAESFRSFLKNNPQHPRVETAKFFYGLTLIKLDDFRQARDVLRAYAADYPMGREAPAAAYWIGHCSFHLDDFAAAGQELSAFAKKWPQNRLCEWALPYLGDLELRQKKPEAAIVRFQEAIKAFPEGALVEDAKFGLARAFELTGKRTEAGDLYRELASNRSGTRAAEAQLNLGALEFDAGRFAEAAAAYETLERQFPESPQAPLARLNQGFARYQLGQFPEAIVQFDKAAKTERFAVEASLWKGLALRAQGNLPQAAEVLHAGYAGHRDHPLAEKLLFHWADCEQRQGAFEKARGLFLEAVDRWPRGAMADESLQAACQAAINGDDLPAADALLARFDRDFPGSRLRLRQEVLKGRLLAARQDWAAAAKHFQSVIETTEIPATGWQARYYFADMLQKRRQHAEALEVSGPLAALWDKGSGPPEFAGVFVLRAVSQLEQARAAATTEKPGAPSREKEVQSRAALESSAKYLSLAPQGPLAAQARSIQVVAQALAGARGSAQEALAALRKNHPGSAELDQALLELGTIAYAREDWEWAETLFGELAARPKDSKLHARALVELGWTEFQRRQYAAAAATFARMLAEHPNDPLADEAAFKRGSALQEDGKSDEAQAAFADAFRRPTASEHVFLAGLQAARLLARSGKMADADATYEALLKRFGQRPDADKVLDAWATTHYSAEDFRKADELFGRLIRDYPNSALADNAALVLAESDLLAGRLDEARRAFSSLAQGARSDEGVRQRSLYQLMRIELEAKRWDDLRRVARDSLARYPEGTYRWDAQWHEAAADFHSGAFKAALDRLTRLAALRQDKTLQAAACYPHVWVLLAETRFKLRDYDGVAATVAEFRAVDGKSPLLYQADEILGRSFKAQAKWAEARQAFARVLEDPNGKSTETAARAQFHIAETWHFEKDYETALKEYLKVDILYKFPEWQAPALLGAAGCQENLKRFPEAAKTYEDILRQYSRDDIIAVKAREGLDRVRRKLAAA